MKCEEEIYIYTNSDVKMKRKEMLKSKYIEEKW